VATSEPLLAVHAAFAMSRPVSSKKKDKKREREGVQNPKNKEKKKKEKVGK
jgi:hypothetical protein